MKFVVAGQVELTATAEDGTPVTVRMLEEGDFLGQTALTREPVTAGAVALTEVTVLEIDRDEVEELVGRKPLLLQEFGRAIEERRRDLRRALAAIRLTVARGTNPLATKVERIRFNFGGLMSEAIAVPVLFVDRPDRAARNGGADRARRRRPGRR